MTESFTLFENMASLLSQDPLLLVSQLSVMALALLVLFLLFYALRDILHRTHSLTYQFLCILLVGVLPVAGFLLYLLVRPARTLAERETDRKVADLWQKFCAVDPEESSVASLPPSSPVS